MVIQKKQHGMVCLSFYSLLKVVKPFYKNRSNASPVVTRNFDSGGIVSKGFSHLLWSKHISKNNVEVAGSRGSPMMCSPVSPDDTFSTTSFPFCKDNFRNLVWDLSHSSIFKMALGRNMYSSYNSVKFWQDFLTWTLSNSATLPRLICCALRARLYAFKNQYARFFRTIVTNLLEGCLKFFTSWNS
jgi:hypothetical protein